MPNAYTNSERIDLIDRSYEASGLPLARVGPVAWVGLAGGPRRSLPPQPAVAPAWAVAFRPTGACLARPGLAWRPPARWTGYLPPALAGPTACCCSCWAVAAQCPTPSLFSFSFSFFLFFYYLFIYLFLQINNNNK